MLQQTLSQLCGAAVTLLPAERLKLMRVWSVLAEDGDKFLRVAGGKRPRPEVQVLDPVPVGSYTHRGARLGHQ
jgi:hypothetical protein